MYITHTIRAYIGTHIYRVYMCIIYTCTHIQVPIRIHMHTCMHTQVIHTYECAIVLQVLQTLQHLCANYHQLHGTILGRLAKEASTTGLELLR